MIERADATRRPTVALVTCRDLPALTDDDRLLVRPLAGAGWRVEPTAWDDPDARWEGFDAIVVRSPWDYYLRPARFLEWIDVLERAAGDRTFNPPSVLRWNADKAYLLELEERGVDVVPTAWIRRGADVELRAVLEDNGWDRAVVKPAVSAGAHRTWVVTREEADAHQHELELMLAESDALVQPFLERIVEDGEWSLVFLGGTFSHAVVKRPAAGDFRVQTRHGGALERADPSAALVDRAEAILAHAPAELLYARVDGIVEGGTLRVIELEALEPALFFGMAPAATDRFVRALGARTGSPPPSRPVPRVRGSHSG